MFKRNNTNCIGYVNDHYPCESYWSDKIERVSQFYSQVTKSTMVKNGTKTIKSIKGNSVIWNQLFSQRIQSTETYAGVTITNTGYGEYTINSNVTSTETVYLGIGNSMTSIVGHKYYLATKVISGSTTATGDLVNAQNLIGGTLQFGKEGIFTPTISRTSSIGIIYNPNDSYSNFKVKYMLIDLTQTFGAGNEPTTTDDYRIKWIKHYAETHLEYNEGELVNFNATGIKSVGKNLFDKNNYFFINGYFTDAEPIKSASNRKIVYLKCKPNTTYVASRIAGKTNERFAIGETDIVPSYGVQPTNIYFAPFSQIVGNKMSVLITTSPSAKYIVIWAYWDDASEALDSLQIEENSTATSYEPYQEDTVTLPISTYFHTGMKSAGTKKDELTPTKAIQRIGTRAYQTGDENDSTLLTDFTNTNYPLSEEVETPINPPLNLTLNVQQGGTETLIGDSTPIIETSDYNFIEKVDGYTIATKGKSFTSKYKAKMPSAVFKGKTEVIDGELKSNNSKYQLGDKTVDLSDIDLQGVGTAQDTYDSQSGKLDRKCATRPYQSGDESDTEVRTDGTTTVYKLATPTTEYIDPQPIDQLYGSNQIAKIEGDIDGEVETKVYEHEVTE